MKIEGKKKERQGQLATKETEKKAGLDQLLSHISLITEPVENGGVGMASLGAAIDASL